MAATVLADSAMLVSQRRRPEHHTWNVRMEILRVLGANGSMRLCDVARRLGISSSHVTYHARLLAESGWIESSLRGRSRILSVASSKDALDWRLSHASVLTERRFLILQVVASHPGVYIRALSQLVGMTPGRVRKEVNELVRHGLIATQRSGRHVELVPNGGAKWALEFDIGGSDL